MYFVTAMRRNKKKKPTSFYFAYRELYLGLDLQLWRSKWQWLYFFCPLLLLLDFTQLCPTQSLGWCEGHYTKPALSSLLLPWRREEEEIVQCFYRLLAENERGFAQQLSLKEQRGQEPSNVFASHLAGFSRACCNRAPRGFTQLSSKLMDLAAK